MKRTAQINWENVHDEIFQHLDLRDEFATLGVEITGNEPNAGGWVTARAIGREDAQPSAAVNIEYGRYKDSGGDGLSCSLFDLAVKLGKATDWKSARKYYAKKAGVRLPGGRELQDPAEHLKFRPWNEALVQLFCNAKPGITPQALRDFGGRIAQYHKQYTVMALPIFGPDLNNADPVGYVLYQLNCKPLPVFQGKSEPARWVKMKTTSGSKPGLLGPFCSPTYNSDTAVVWKTEGPADALALWAAFPPDVQAMATVVTNANGATETPKDTMAVAFAWKKTILIHDADSAGETGAAKWLPWLSQIAQEVRHVRLPYQIEPSHGKDVRDYLTADGGTVQQLFDLAENAPVFQPTKKTTQQNTYFLEGDDDENRLSSMPPEIVASDLVDSCFTVNENKILGHWRNSPFMWSGGIWNVVSDGDLEARINKKIIEKNLCHITNSAFGNVMAQVRRATKLPDSLEPPFIVGNDSSLPDYVKEWDLSYAVFGTDGILYLPWLQSRVSECFLPLSPAFFNLTSVGCSVRPRADIPEPTRWLEFLQSTWSDDPEAIEAFQLWCGLLLVSDLSQHKILLVIGPRRSGKTTIANLLRDMFPGSIANPTFHTLLESFGLSILLNKSVAIIGDARLPRTDVAIITERLLTISGGDTLTVNRKHREQLNVRLGCRVMVLSNELPSFYDASTALASRMIILPMIKSFYGRENLNLASELRSELQGIFWWMVDGWLKLQERGHLFQPQSGKELVRELEELSSPTLQFMRERCETGPSFSVEKSTLYGAYCEWCNQNGRGEPSQARFFRDIKSAHPELSDTRPREKGKRVLIVRGVRLNLVTTDVFNSHT